MSLDIYVNERLVKVKLLERKDNLVKVQVNEKVYDIDIVKACENNYSVLYLGKSHVIDMAVQQNPTKYYASTYTNNYNVEIIDNTKLRSKGSSSELITKTISSPMSGSVVKIFVNIGDEIKIGQTLIVVEAMKMQSEFKSTIDSKVKKINVSEGETVTSGKILIELD